MNADALLDPPPVRPLWLWTLADLALLLIGFFVLVQATDRRALARGLREEFGGPVTEAVVAPIPLAAVAVTFIAGSAVPGEPDRLAVFAAAHLRDPRASLRVSGATAGAGDVDPATRSADLLAYDRARAVVSYLIGRGVPAERIVIASSGTGRRTALVTVNFDGDRTKRTRP